MDDAKDCQYIDYYSVYTFNIHAPYLMFLTNQNQALVTLCLHAYLNFTNCDLYAAYWWPMIGNKLYSILFYSIQKNCCLLTYPLIHYHRSS